MRFITEIDWNYLKKTYFNNRLTQNETDIFNKGLKLDEFAHMLSEGTNDEKIKFLICFFYVHRFNLFKKVPKEIAEVVNQDMIVKAAILTAQFELIESLGLPTDVLKNILNTKTILEALISTKSDYLERFLDYLSFDTDDDINTTVKDLSADDVKRLYYLACQKARLDILTYLEWSKAIDITTITLNHWYYSVACEYGQVSVLRCLERLPGFSALEAAKGSHYLAFRRACLNGHLAILKHLRKLPGFSLLDAAQSYGSFSYIDAARNGHLNVMKYLEAIPGFYPLLAARADNYSAFSGACRNGDIDVVRHLLEIPCFNVKEAVKARNYRAYRDACRFGHDAIKQYLVKVGDIPVDVQVEENPFLKNGLFIPIFFDSDLNSNDVLPVSHVKDDAKLKEYQAYLSACTNGGGTTFFYAPNSVANVPNENERPKPQPSVSIYICESK